MNRLLDPKFMKKVKHDYFSATRTVCRNKCLTLVKKPDICRLQSIRKLFTCSFETNVSESKRKEIFSKMIFPPLENVIIPAIINSNELLSYLERIMHSGRHFQLTILPQPKVQSPDIQVAEPSQGTGAEESKSIKIIRLKRNLKQSSSKNKNANSNHVSM